ncbi:MAG: choice-of-anchor L domain-containing protein [Bacteroidetes bacterium]|nr:choice-of-anchor L domain-containing protein [Bacteroidota bacterium]
MKRLSLLFSTLLFAVVANAQLIITDEPSATALVQKLVGDGVTISNVSFTGNSLMAGKFKNLGGLTNINLDSGIVITNGRAKTTTLDQFGVDGNGIDLAEDVTASNLWNLPGDAQLANEIGADVSDLNDACVLEFDFIPSGDTIKFRYVFSSEEYYPGYVCTYNDAFGFFLSGPGITGSPNIALIPGTNTPVSIFNVNNVTELPANCPNNTAYYIDNTSNRYFTHDGHTSVFTAIHAVIPCQVYHLKLVVADFQDDALDTGVFLEAKSLTSNIVRLINNTQTDNLNNSYIVEGCITGSFSIKRPGAPNYPLQVAINYSGSSATNGVDMQTLPAIVTIPANDSMVTIPIIPTIDNIPEGIETIKISVSAGCTSVATDSAIIQLRDYDTLTVLPHVANICKDGSVQLSANQSWSTFQWDNIPGLDNYTVNNPVATPLQSLTTYYCTSTTGSCNGRDSVLIQWKELEFNNQVNVNCQNGTTGQISVSAGPEWEAATTVYSIDNLPTQPSGTFTNLPVGNYMVHVTDATGCEDSLPVHIIQAYPNLEITNAAVVGGSCVNTTGSITVTASGGLPAYQYSIDGSTFQGGNIFTVPENTYNITIHDANNCTAVFNGVVVPVVNDLAIIAGPDTTICSGQPVTLVASGTATSYTWTPTTWLSTPNSASTVAIPLGSITYTVTAVLGACQAVKTVKIEVDKSLTIDAGGPLNIDAGGAAQAHVVVSGANPDISTVLWTASEGLSATNVLNPVISPLQTTGTITYSITVTNTSGCSASDELIVKILPSCIKLRNAFTPNGDGINDRWWVYDDFSCLKNVAVHVFNRYGSKVYESENYRNTWDGKYKGKELPDGTYYAVVEYTFLSGRVKTERTDLTILR